MNRLGRSIRVALIATLMAPVGGNTNEAEAQSDALLFGNQYGTFLDAPATLPISGLPAPGLPDTYDGTPATKSQVIRTNGEGCLLVFMIDGNIYDKDGYLIADASGSGCVQCLVPGVMEKHLVPVPDHCDLFYVIGSFPAIDNSPPAQIEVALLDLEATNPYHSTRKGRVWDLTGSEVVAAHPDIASIINDLGFMIHGPHTAWLPGSQTGKNNSPMIRIIDVNGDGTNYAMYFILKDRVYVWKINSSGFQQVLTAPDGFIPITTQGQGNNSPSTQKSFSRDADVALAPDGKLMLTVSDWSLDVWDPVTNTFDEHFPVLVLKFNSASSTLYSIESLPLDGNNGYPHLSYPLGPISPWTNGSLIGGPKGCVIVEGGNKILVTGMADNGTAWVPTIGMYDLNTSAWTDLISALNIPSPINYVWQRLYRNRYPGTTDEAVIVPYSGGVAAIKGTVNMATATFETSVPTSSTVMIPDFIPDFSTGEDPPVFLNTQISKETYALDFANETEGFCCFLKEDICAIPGHIQTTNSAWTSTNNPFGNLQEVRFSENVVVASGVNLNITNMILRFAPDARLIIERGARLTIYNTTLTTYKCSDLRWPGVLVEGNRANTYQDDDPNLPITAEQGRFYMLGSMIENAFHGVWCTREVSGSEDPNYRGVGSGPITALSEIVCMARGYRATTVSMATTRT